MDAGVEADQDFCVYLGHDLCHSARPAAAGLCTCACHAEKLASGQDYGYRASSAGIELRDFQPPTPRTSGQQSSQPTYSISLDPSQPGVPVHTHSLTFTAADYAQLARDLDEWFKRISAAWNAKWEDFCKANNWILDGGKSSRQYRQYEIDLRRRGDFYRRSAQDHQARTGAQIVWRYPRPSSDARVLNGSPSPRKGGKTGGQGRKHRKSKR